MKTGTHEIAHIFSIPHCITYFCTMNGSNSLKESDSRPLACCPECMAKICYGTKTNPESRYEKLELFCRQHKFHEEAKFYGDLLINLRKK